MNVKKTLSVCLGALLLSLLAACGVKNDLMTPSGHQTPAGQNDPSKPPSPIGQ